MRPATPSVNLLSSFLDNPEIPSAENAQACEGKLMVAECFKSLQLFENSKNRNFIKLFGISYM